MVTSYNLQPRNGAGLFSKKKISKEKVKKKDNWGSIRCRHANDIYIYSSKISRWIKGTVLPEPGQGLQLVQYSRSAVCLDTNFHTKWLATKIFSMPIHLDLIYIKSIDQGHRSASPKFTKKMPLLQKLVTARWLKIRPELESVSK